MVYPEPICRRKWSKLSLEIQKLDKICVKCNITKGDYSELARRLIDLPPIFPEYEEVCLDLTELEAGDQDQNDYGDFEDAYYDIIGIKPVVASSENDLSSLKLPSVQLSARCKDAPFRL